MSRGFLLHPLAYPYPSSTEYVVVSYSDLTAPRPRLSVVLREWESPFGVPLTAVEQSALCSRRVTPHPLPLGGSWTGWTGYSTPREHEAGVQSSLRIGSLTDWRSHHPQSSSRSPPTDSDFSYAPISLPICLQTCVPRPYNYVGTPRASTIISGWSCFVLMWRNDTRPMWSSIMDGPAIWFDPIVLMPPGRESTTPPL